MRRESRGVRAIVLLLATLGAAPRTGAQPADWVRANLHATDDPAAARIRAVLLTRLWGVASLPGARAGAVEADVDPRDLGSPVELPNLATIDRYTVVTRGNVVRPFVLHPVRTTRRVAIIAHGHSRTPTLAGAHETAKLVQAALERGNTVIFVPMPGTGTADHDRLGRDLTEAFHPLRYFLEPPIVALNEYLATHASPDRITCAGISGGGWLTVLLGALDERISTSIPIAGSLPLALRHREIASDHGDWEQRLPGLTWDGREPLEYLDLYLMAASGGRSQIQVNNASDRCCFFGERHRAYADVLTGINPRWRFHGERFDGHGAGDALATVVAPTFGSPLPELP